MSLFTKKCGNVTFFTKKCGNAALNQGWRGPLLLTGRWECTTFTLFYWIFRKSGRFCRLIFVILWILLKSGGIPSRFWRFLFNYWKVLHRSENTFLCFFRGTKISSDKVSYYPTLFWHGTVLGVRKRRLRHRHSTKSDGFDHFRKKWPFTAKMSSFSVSPKILIVTWYYSRSTWLYPFTRGGGWIHLGRGVGGRGPLWGGKWPLLTGKWHFFTSKSSCFGLKMTTFYLKK